VTAWINAGSRFEGAEVNGVAHVMETAALQAKSKEIAALGGMVSGYTTREHIVFEAQVLNEHVPQATALLGELAKPVADVESAKAIVADELAAAAANPQEVLMEHLHDAAFLDTPMGMSVLGTPETVAALGADDVAAFAAANVAAERTVVTAAGSMDPKAFADAAAKAFGGLPSLPAGAVDATSPATFTGSDKRMRFDSMDAAHVAVAFKSVPFDSPEVYPLMVMQAYLGGFDKTSATIPARNLTSRLSIDQGEQEAATAISTFNLTYKDAGLFGVYFQAPDNRMEDSMWYSLWNLVRMAHKTSDAEVDFAKAQLKSQLAAQYSTTSGTAAALAKGLSLTGRPSSLADVLASIDAVDAAAVRAVAKEVVNDEDHALAAIGPIYELPDYNWIRRRSYWLRY